MRRHKESKRKKVIQIFLGLFITFIMVFSVFELYVSNQGSQASLQYGKFRFTVDADNRKYLTVVNKTTYAFYSFPTDAAQVNVTGDFADTLRSAEVIIYTLDPRAQNLEYVEQARYELMSMIAQSSVPAVTQNSSLYRDALISSCADARQYAPVVFFNVSDNLSIIREGYCIILNGNATDFYVLQDRLLYGYVGIIPE
ncbi:MAG: hypothetical protein V1743_05515 [Nanoarchaeota archaeon]